MKSKQILMTGVLCLATIGCLDVSGNFQAPEFGVRAAEARDYYTRKRINGKWVTGMFPKKGTKAQPSPQPREVADAALAVEPPKPPQPTLLGLNIPGVDLTYRPPMGSQVQPQQQPEQTAAIEPASLETASYTGTRSSKATGRFIAGTPGVQEKVAADVLPEQKSARVARSSEPKRERVARAAPKPSAAERKRADEEFVSAVTQPNRVAEPTLPPAAQAYAPMPERNDLLTALQRKARAIAEEEASRVTGSVGTVALPVATIEPSRPALPPVRSAKAMKPIRSMTLDYENGIRTTIFQDGSIEEEQVELRP